MNCLKMNWSENGCFNEFKSARPSVNTSSDTQTKKIVCIGRKLLELKQHLLTDKNGNNVLLRVGMIIARWHSSGTPLLNLGRSLPAGRKVLLYKPCATYNARFITFGIYANMTFNFSDQMKYDKEIKQHCRDSFCLFLHSSPFLSVLRQVLE